MLSRRSIIVAVASAAVLAGVGVSAYALTGRTPRYQPRSLPVVAPSVTPSIQAASPAPPVARSVPVRISIPAIGVNAPVDQELTDAATRTMQVPPLSGPQANDTGWWAPGFTPGQAGESVIAGHVNTAEGTNPRPLVFANLGSLVKGDTVTVTLANGQKVPFTVTAKQEISKQPSSFWTTFWNAATPSTAPRSAATLALVTCGGSFNSGTGHYDDNVIIYAALV